jgi:hypothetical protein
MSARVEAALRSMASSFIKENRSERMSVGETSGPIHPVPTRRGGYRYQFYDKHHGRGAPDVARWMPSITHHEEFAIFDAADQNEFSDEQGCLFGVGPRDEDGEIPDLGTWGQQIAEFPFARPNATWHGYPLCPLAEAGPENRKGEKGRPSRIVFLRMEAVGVLTPRERKRLYKGDHL